MYMKGHYCVEYFSYFHNYPLCYIIIVSNFFKTLLFGLQILITNTIHAKVLLRLNFTFFAVKLYSLVNVRIPANKGLIFGLWVSSDK